MSRSILENIMQTCGAAGRQLKVRSALDPIVLLCIVWSPVALGFALKFDTRPMLQSVLVFGAFCPPGIACFSYLYMLFKKPEMLRSEKLQIQQQAMELIQRKGVSKPISPESIQAIANPNTQRKSERSNRNE